MPQLHNVALNPSLEEEQALRKHYQDLLQTLERGLSLKPAYLTALREQMYKHLSTLEGFAQIYEDDTNHHNLHLHHGDNQLLNLPWRLAVADRPYLYLTKGPKPVAEQPYQPDIPLPLKVLVMVAAPEDLDRHGRLAYEEEELSILQAFEPLFANGRVQVDFTQVGSLTSLEEKLKANRYHILHFSGHGVFREQENMGYLLLENEYTLRKELVPARNFAQSLNIRPRHRPALVLLSSCQTGQGSHGAGIRGVANHLLHIGIPAVVGMSFSILDYFATSFAAELYKELAEKADLGQAFYTAVRKIQAEEQQLLQRTPGQWMIPQLYTSQQVEQLVDWEAPFDELELKAVAFVTGKDRLLLEEKENYLFIGRRKERRDALKALKEKKVVMLRGQGGVGKTSLAEHLVGRLIAEDPKVYPFLVNEQEFKTTKRFFPQVMEYLEQNHQEYQINREVARYETDEEKLGFLLKKLVKVCKPVFVFDNVETFQRAPGEGFSPQYADLEGLFSTLLRFKTFPILITGRYPLPKDWQIPVVNLNQVGYNDFFRKCLQLNLRELYAREFQAQKRTGGSLPGKEQVSFADLVHLLHETLGGNYRALEFFDQVFHEKKAEILPTLEKLEVFREQLKGEHREEVVQRLREHSRKLVFKELIDLTTAAEQQLLRVLAQFRVPVLPQALRMQGIQEEIQPALTRLEGLTLIEVHQVPFQGGESLTYHYVTPLVQDFLESTSSSPVPFSHSQAGKYFEYVGREINHPPYADLEEAFWHFRQVEEQDRLHGIGLRLSNFYYAVQQFGKAWYYGLATVQVVGEESSPDIWNKLGLIALVIGENKKALFFFGEAHQRYTEIGDRKGEGTTLNNISQIYDAKGDYDQALSYLEKSLKIQQEIGDRQGEGTTLNNLATTAHAKGDYDQALSYLEKSLKIRQEIGDRKGESVTYNNIAQIYQVRGDLDKALDYMEKDLKICQEIGDRKGEGTTLNNISQIHKVRGDYDQALSYLEKSLKIQQEIGDRQGEGTTLNNLATTAHAKGDYDQALSYLEKSLKIRQEIGDRQGEGTTLNNISQIHKVRGDYDQALSYLEKSLKIQQEIGDRKGEGTTLNNISQIYDAKGDYDQALSYLEKSLKIRQEIGDRQGEGTTLNNISQIHQVRGDYDQALSYLEKSLKIQQEIGDRQGEGTTLNNISQIHQVIGDYDQALSYLEKSLKIRQEIGDLSGLTATLHNMATLYLAKGEGQTYLEMERQAYQLAKQIGNGHYWFTIAHYLGSFLCDNGRVEEGLPYLQECLILGQRLQHPQTPQIAQLIQQYSPA